jgi:hypothetical protein
MKGIGTTQWQTLQAKNVLGTFADGFDGLNPTGMPISVEIFTNVLEVTFHGCDLHGNDVEIRATIGQRLPDANQPNAVGIVYARRHFDEAVGGMTEWTRGTTLSVRGEVK